MSNYKNELGTISAERLIEITTFINGQQDNGIYEMSEHISDFAEKKEKEMALRFSKFCAVNNFDPVVDDDGNHGYILPKCLRDSPNLILKTDILNAEETFELFWLLLKERNSQNQTK
jgi:hypothetical protein